MGWDVDAIYDDNRNGYVDTENDAIANQAFRNAVSRALMVCSFVDGWLERGGLDFSDSVCILARYANETDGLATWDSAEVKRKWESIEWPDLSLLSEPELEYLVSAREFLRTCAESGYGIQFDP